MRGPHNHDEAMKYLLMIARKAPGSMTAARRRKIFGLAWDRGYAEYKLDKVPVTPFTAKEIEFMQKIWPEHSPKPYPTNP